MIGFTTEIASVTENSTRNNKKTLVQPHPIIEHLVTKTTGNWSSVSTITTRNNFYQIHIWCKCLPLPMEIEVYNMAYCVFLSVVLNCESEKKLNTQIDIYNFMKNA